MMLLFLLAVRGAQGLIYNPPHCALPGLQVGAGLGTVAGAFGGVAAAGGASTLATCPTLAITTLAGTGMMGPAAPLVALLTGALLGGVAGGTAGGVYSCKVEGDHLLIQYQPKPSFFKGHHSEYEPAYKPLPGYNHHIHPLPYHGTEAVAPYHELHYTVPQSHHYSKFDRTGEAVGVDRLGEPAMEEVLGIQTPEDWLARYMMPRLNLEEEEEDLKLEDRRKEDLRTNYQAGFEDLNTVGEKMEPSGLVGSTETETSLKRKSSMETSLEKKKTYVAMLEKLLKFRLGQRQEEAVVVM